MALYKSWVANEFDDTAIVVYDTMWHSTEAMAHAIESAFLACGMKPRLYNLHYCHNSDIIADAMTAKYIAVGSPTLNNNMMPSVASFLTYFKGLTGNKKKFIAFGSYGWGGQSPDQVYEMLAASKCEALLPAIKIAYKPSKEQLDKISADVANAIRPREKRPFLPRAFLLFSSLWPSALQCFCRNAAEQIGEQISFPDQTHIFVVCLIAFGIIVTERAEIGIVRGPPPSRFRRHIADKFHIRIVIPLHAGTSAFIIRQDARRAKDGRQFF